MDEFDIWNKVKKKIDTDSVVKKYPKENEVWMVSLGKNIGLEQNGGKDFMRPVLIIKKFNNQIFWGVPLSRKQKKIDFYYNFSDPQGENVSVILAQLRMVSIKRMERKLYDFEKEKFDAIAKILKSYL